MNVMEILWAAAVFIFIIAGTKLAFDTKNIVKKNFTT